MPRRFIRLHIQQVSPRFPWPQPQLLPWTSLMMSTTNLCLPCSVLTNKQKGQGLTGEPIAFYPASTKGTWSHGQLQPRTFARVRNSLVRVQVVTLSAVPHLVGTSLFSSTSACACADCEQAARTPAATAAETATQAAAIAAAVTTASVALGDVSLMESAPEHECDKHR